MPRELTYDEIKAVLPSMPGGLTMSKFSLAPVDRPNVAPLAISPRLRTQLVYFMSAAGTPGVPTLGENEYWIASDGVATWLDDGVIALVSPLDTAHMTEVELTEEQEALLNWLQRSGVQHVRVVEA